jgi:glycosyltransferase involved in cell wall biosynthesis
MIEAMACGTPVIAFRRGSIPEVVDEGESGFIVDDVKGAIQAVAKATTLDRRKCREVFERRFTSARMAKDYLETYAQLANGKIEKSCESEEDGLWMTSSV